MIVLVGLDTMKFLNMGKHWVEYEYLFIHFKLCHNHTQQNNIVKKV